MILSSYAWNHSGVYPDTATIWMGMAGPGVRHLGIDDRTWADQTDVRPTTLALLGQSWIQPRLCRTRSAHCRDREDLAAWCHEVVTQRPGP
jgi:hypothetical protein